MKNTLVNVEIVVLNYVSIKTNHLFVRPISAMSAVFAIKGSSEMMKAFVSPLMVDVNQLRQLSVQYLHLQNVQKKKSFTNARVVVLNIVSIAMTRLSVRPKRAKPDVSAHRIIIDFTHS